MAAWGTVSSTPTPTAFENHLRAITSSFELQVSVMRSALDLSTPSASLDYRKAADGAIDRFAKAIGDLRSDLLGAATGVPRFVGLEGLETHQEEPLELVKVADGRNSEGTVASRAPDGAEPDRMSASSWDADVVAVAATAQLEEKSRRGHARKVCVHGVFNPQWSGRLVWDFTVIFLVLVDGLVLPFQLAEFVGEGAFDSVWLWFTTSFFLCDLAMNFMTGYLAGKRDVDFQEGTLVTDKISIAQHYVRGWFWIDFLSTIPWTVIGDELSGTGNKNSAGNVTKITKIVKLTRLLRLMRMLRLAKIAALWDQLEGRIGSITFLNLVNLVKALGVIFAICHWGACVWWMVGKEGSLVTGLTEDSHGDTLHWTSLPRVHSPYDDVGEWKWIQRPATEQYMFCFYWILGVMRTMPAEVTPVNLTERTFVLIFMLFAVAAFAVFVAKITQAYFRFGARNDAFKEELACVRLFLRKINCEESLQARTQAYLRHVFEQRKIHAKELNLINALPDGLKRKLTHARVLHELRKLPILQDKSSAVLKRVCDICEVIDFLPGDRLTEKDRPADAAYVLMGGGLQIWTQPSSSRGSLASRWSMMETNRPKKLTVVDEYCLVDQSEVSSKHTVIALECSEVLRVDRARFFDVLGFENREWREQESDPALINLKQQGISSQPLRAGTAELIRMSSRASSSAGRARSSEALDERSHDLRGAPGSSGGTPGARAQMNRPVMNRENMAAGVASGVSCA